jgi:hypothetical protein
MPVFDAVARDGQLVIADVSRWKTLLTKHSGKRFRVELERVTQPRSNQANRYYYDLCQDHIAPALSEVLGQAITKDDAADWCAHKFLPPRWVDGVRLRPDTHVLTTTEFYEFVERIREFFLHDPRFELYLPEPNEQEAVA